MSISLKFKALSKIWRHQDAIRAFLQFYESPAAAFSGSVQPKELVFLEELVARAAVLPGPIIEVGTLFGFTTQQIAMWKPLDKVLVTIDNFSWNPIGMPASAHQTFTTRNLFYVTQKANVQIFAGPSEDYHKSYAGEKPAMIFIDAGHTYEEAMVDIRWAAKMKIPIISGHDYSDSHPGVKKAVNEVFGTAIKVVGSVWAHVD